MKQTANAKKKRQQVGGARKPSRASWSGQELSQSNVPACSFQHARYFATFATMCKYQRLVPFLVALVLPSWVHATKCGKLGHYMYRRSCPLLLGSTSSKST